MCVVWLGLFTEAEFANCDCYGPCCFFLLHVHVSVKHPLTIIEACRSSKVYSLCASKADNYVVNCMS